MSDETMTQLVDNLNSVCESSDVPEWALELIKCFKGLIVKLDNIQNLDIVSKNWKVCKMLVN